MARTPFELDGKTVFVAGHKGMVGGALVRRLKREIVELLSLSRSEVDLRDQAAVFAWFAKARPQAVFLAAAKVGTKNAAERSLDENYTHFNGSHVTQKSVN
jgi:GDP-L-fucose synthase